MYRLVVSDIDATLIDSQFRIPEYNLEMIRRVREAGIDFMLCTGRIFGAARPYAKFLGLTTPLITSNGAVTMEWENHKVLYRMPMPAELCADIFRELERLGLYYHFYSTETFYAKKLPKESGTIQATNEKLPPEERIVMLEVADPAEAAAKDPAYKISVRCYNKDDEEKFLGAFSGRTDIALTSSFEGNYEISAPGVDKSAAIARYAEEHGIRPEEIISFGDNRNDVGMIRYAGVGVAVANAVEELKAAADYITDTNDHCGVGKALAKFVFGE